MYISNLYYLNPVYKCTFTHANGIKKRDKSPYFSFFTWHQSQIGVPLFVLLLITIPLYVVSPPLSFSFLPISCQELVSPLLSTQCLEYWKWSNKIMKISKLSGLILIGWDLTLKSYQIVKIFLKGKETF